MHLSLILGIVLFAIGTTQCEAKIALVSELDVSKRSLESHPDLLSVQVAPEDGAVFTLALTKTRGMSQPDNVKVFLDAPVAEGLAAGKIETKSLSNVGYYQDKSKRAVLAVINDGTSGENKRKLFGTLILDGKTYEIQPVSKDVQELTDLIESRKLHMHESHMVHTLDEVTLPDMSYKVDYKKKLMEKEAKMAKEEESSVAQDKLSQLLEAFLTKREQTAKRRKRQADDQETVFHVELTFLVEYSVFQFWMNELNENEMDALEHIKFVYTHLFHGMYLTYANIDSSTIAIRPWLKAMHIATTQAASPYAILTGDQIELADTEDYIRKIYMPQNNLNWANTDHIMMWTKRTLRDGPDEGILGLAADICGICKPGRSITQQHEYGLFSFFTGAHELGHVLGALHDDNAFNRPECRINQLHLMTPRAIELSATTFQNSFEFSDCSVFMFEQCFRGNSYNDLISDWTPSPEYPRVCVFDNICEHGEPVEDDLEEALPGEEYTLTEQCQLGTGNENAVYTSTCQGSADVCHELRCEIGSQCGIFGNVEQRAVAGSPCETGKVCWMGDCVTKGSFDYTPSHGSVTCEEAGDLDDSCQDTDSASTCSTTVLNKPWNCFAGKRLRCSRTCMEWGLYDVNNAPCAIPSSGGSSSGGDGGDTGGDGGDTGGDGGDTGGDGGSSGGDGGDTGGDGGDTDGDGGGSTGGGGTDPNNPPAPTTSSSWQYTLCGYDPEEGYLVTCPNHEKCIPMWYYGDKEADCPDGADEIRSEAKKIPSGFVGYSRCPFKFRKLIPDDWYCDGENDCSWHGREELQKNCNKQIKYFDALETASMNCPNDPTKEVSIFSLCDGVNDCGEGDEATDEDPYICWLHHNVQCDVDQLTCPFGVIGRPCIAIWEACDGYNDCFDPVDEDQDFCDSLPSVSCGPGDFQCPTKHYVCYPNDYLCDGVDDCGDESDEECSSSFKEAPHDQLLRELGSLLDKKIKQSKKIESKKDAEEKITKIKATRAKRIRLAKEMTKMIEAELETSPVAGRELEGGKAGINLDVMRSVTKELRNAETQAKEDEGEK